MKPFASFDLEIYKEITNNTLDDILPSRITCAAIKLEGVKKILYYYDCQANLEDSRISILAYYREQKAMNRLIKRPRIASSSSTRQSNLIGTPATKKVISHALSLINDYIEDFYRHIYFKDMLDELREYDYDNKTKYDIIAAMGMCELYDEELGNLSASAAEDTKDEGFKGVGWYTDENGYRKFGSLEHKNNKGWNNQLSARGRSLKVNSFMQ